MLTSKPRINANLPCLRVSGLHVFFCWVTNMLALVLFCEEPSVMPSAWHDAVLMQTMRTKRCHRSIKTHTLPYPRVYRCEALWKLTYVHVSPHIEYMPACVQRYPAHARHKNLPETHPSAGLSHHTAMSVHDVRQLLCRRSRRMRARQLHHAQAASVAPPQHPQQPPSSCAPS